jgi:hypothetical protein
VKSEDGNVELLPVNRSQNSPYIFSDWLLGTLGIESMSLYLQFGEISAKLNFTDLARLMYHNQLPDPSGIYKAPDLGGFVSDSKVFRKAIFEILAGKLFQEFYMALANFRELEKQRDGAANALEYFKRFIKDARPNQKDLNVVFINRRIGELKDQLEKAIGYRRSLTRVAESRHSVDTNSGKQALLRIEIESSETLRKENDLANEMGRLQKLKADLILEVTQIKKMMFTHERLNLFSINTCPYCLREVKRELHRCVCGAEVDEAHYEKFFYTSSEYMVILKAKQRNVETIDAAIASCQEDIQECRQKVERLTSEGAKIKRFIANVVEASDSVVDLAKFDRSDEQIVQLRGELGSLEQQKELEIKRDELEQKFASVKVKYEAVQVRLSQLRAQVEGEMESKRESFSSIYQSFMRETVQGCRTAMIDADYMPVLNKEEYREASVDVQKRLYYYLTMMQMALDDVDIRFPRFLLIDTPETAGIDERNLIACLGQIQKMLSRRSKPDCQIILTTGVGKYPPECEDRVFARLSDENPLLRLRSSRASVG